MSSGREDAARFGNAERLALHQLRLLEWLDARGGRVAGSDQKMDSAVGPVEIPAEWRLAQGVDLYEWQKDCIERWFKGGCRGTVKVVTGAGKTILALALAERLQNQRVPELRVVVVVPTIVLMHQWFDELIERGNLPRAAIGRLGGGYKDDFSGGRRVLIAVLASAHKLLPRMVRKERIGKRLLLVADECHRLGAKEMSQVFETERAFSLGLSATPERDDDEPSDEDAGYDGSVLGQALGPIIFDFTLADALKLGIVPTFTIHHYGLPLNEDERGRYERLSRSISDSQSELRNRAPGERSSGPAFFQWARMMSSRGGGDVGSMASKLIGDISRRKELLHSMSARAQAVERLLKREFQLNPDARAILFHESIDEVMRLFIRLRNAGLPAIAEHSELPASVREAGLDIFRKGIARVIVSARSLIEGFNVPAVDIGIIVASSTSVRQRIQSLGRVLRRHRGPSGEEKTSCIHVLYARDTVDDFIYAKLDWDKTTGIERNLYYQWDPGAEPQQQPGPPRAPLPPETDVDATALAQGAVYPGAYEGVELSCDTRGNVRDAQGRFATNPGQLAELVRAVKGGAGRFRVTPRCQFVLVRVAELEDWSTRYVTRLAEPLRFQATADASEPANDAQLEEWVKTAAPGAPYPSTSIPTTIDALRFKKKGGGVISKRVPGGEVFARVGDRAQDAACGADAFRLIAAVRELHAKGEQVSHLEVNAKNHVVHRAEGKLFFVCALAKGLEFPS
jgi:superfamily II DNA or RNA helicase